MSKRKSLFTEASRSRPRGRCPIDLTAPVDSNPHKEVYVDDVVEIAKHTGTPCDDDDDLGLPPPDDEDDLAWLPLPPRTKRSSRTK